MRRGRAFTTAFGGYGLHRQRRRPGELGSRSFLSRVRGLPYLGLVRGLLLTVGGATALRP
ncbi:MAG TPA: hypothetical protein VFD01_22405 [Candidatus Dormibacteraeota bacterium]|nr:hypothetical protein [Candidatus Dormibacteraeota bacterium]